MTQLGNSWFLLHLVELPHLPYEDVHQVPGYEVLPRSSLEDRLEEVCDIVPMQ